MSYNHPLVITVGVLIALLLFANIWNAVDWFKFRRKLNRRIFYRRPRR